MNTAYSGTRSPASDTDQSVTEAVVQAVADAEGIRSNEVTTPLATALDPDALEAVVESVDGNRPSPSVCVEFRYCGYLVTVSTDGSVELSQS